MFLFFVIGDKTVDLAELHRSIVPLYATRWKDLGIELRIPMHHINIIAADHAHHPSFSEECCKAVFHKWMEISPKHTWSILQKAINSLPSSSHDGSSESKK